MDFQDPKFFTIGKEEICCDRQLKALGNTTEAFLRVKLCHSQVLDYRRSKSNFQNFVKVFPDQNIYKDLAFMWTGMIFFASSQIMDKVPEQTCFATLPSLPGQIKRALWFALQ